MPMSHCALTFKVFFFYLAALLYTAGIPSVANAQPAGGMCRGPNAPASELKMHTELLTYAVLAEAAYAKKSPWTPALPDSCTTVDIPSDITEPVDTLPISDHIVADATSAIYSDADFAGEQLVLESYVPEDNSETFLACTHDTAISERIAMAVRYAWERNKLSLLIKVAIVGFAPLTSTEELEIMELRSTQNERILGVQGTDVTRIIPQLTTSIHELMGNSCLFDLAVEISNAFFVPSMVNEFHADHNAIVGHSLGGAVAQYVGRRLDLQESIRSFRNSAAFGAYSFNSVGLGDASGDAPHYANIHSVRVVGEILEGLEEEFETSQIGNEYRYEPSERRYLLAIREKINRHSIRRVQSEICRCLGGEGGFDYSPAHR